MVGRVSRGPECGNNQSAPHLVNKQVYSHKAHWSHETNSIKHKKKYITTRGHCKFKASLAPTVRVCWRRAKARGYLYQTRRDRADGQHIVRWNPKSSAAGNGSRSHPLGRSFFSGGRFLIENPSQLAIVASKPLSRFFPVEKGVVSQLYLFSFGDWSFTTFNQSCPVAVIFWQLREVCVSNSHSNRRHTHTRLSPKQHHSTGCCALSDCEEAWSCLQTWCPSNSLQCYSQSPVYANTAQYILE